ncbi:MAG: S9 family peptidase [Flavobacteriales bacterium TMED191]|nr:MAG: S9 family peptidase [Flavobacteriales bacterium TMED191]
MRIIFLLSILLTCCMNKDKSNYVEPPIAKKYPEKLSIHGDERLDNYYWMRLTDKQKEAKNPDQQTKDVLNYLNAENQYLKSKMKHTESLQEKLFNEIKNRIKKDDSSVPITINNYSYYTRFEKDKEYPFHCRKKIKDQSQEEIMLDVSKMAVNFDYFSVVGLSVSPDEKLLIYGVDTVSRREYTLYIKNLNTGEILIDKISNTTGRGVWANDNKTFFYTKQDPITLRSFQIYKHILGTPQSQDVLVYEEKDDTFNCYVSKSKSKKYIIIGSYQTLSSEYRYIDANKPNQDFKIVQKREKDLEYNLYHYEDHFYILTNYKAKNFRLMKTLISQPSKEYWTEVIPHNKNILIEGLDIFKNYLVVEERKNGLTNIRIINWENNKSYYIKFNDPAYTVSTMANPEYNTNILRYGYTSLTTPSSTFDYNMDTKEKSLLKQDEVLGNNFSIDNYESKRYYAISRDGNKIPISLVYKKGIQKNSKNPLLLYGYGSYGYSMDPYFSSVRLSLLDRGFVFAIAHIRGGEELGRKWYEDGKLLNKKNTFYDFIDCAEFLISKKYTSIKHLYASGGSAGGLLMGAVINMRPDLWRGVIAGVPFVDVVSTMLDESIPLTTGEFDEWGNPKDSIYYDYIKSYSPYDNIESKEYPNLLITTGYWDSQVQYWEPAKWIAKLREMKTDQNLLLMDCNMDVGHGGASGRFKRYKEISLEYSFLLDLENIKN